MVKFILLSVLSIGCPANTFASDSVLFQGTWVLDSIQVNENSADGVILKTLLPGERYKFEPSWLSRFSLDEANETASYTLTTGQSFSGTPYRLTPNGKDYTLFISGTPVVKNCIARLLPGGNKLLLEEKYSNYYKEQPINILWRFYYHRL